MRFACVVGRQSAGDSVSSLYPPKDKMRAYHLDHLQYLETESIHALREVAAEFERPCLLFSGGKDSVCLLRLAEKAFSPSDIPMPLLNIDTGHHFPELNEFRDRRAEELGVRLIVRTVEEAMAKGIAVPAGGEGLDGFHGGGVAAGAGPHLGVSDGAGHGAGDIQHQGQVQGHLLGGAGAAKPGRNEFDQGLARRRFAGHGNAAAVHHAFDVNLCRHVCSTSGEGKTVHCNGCEQARPLRRARIMGKCVGNVREGLLQEWNGISS